MAITQSYKNSPNYYDVLIVGGGPAGLTAGIYSKRAGLKTAFFERDTPGGKVTRTAFVENYPGFKKIEGYNLAIQMLGQATELGVEFKYGNVISIEKERNIFILTTEDGTLFYAKAVIIATGMKERKLGCKGEEELFNKGVSYCAICDGAFYKNEDVVIVGGGNSAFEESLFLSDICKKIYIVNMDDKFLADKLVVEKVKQNPKIEIIINTVLESIDGTNHVEGVTTRNVITNQIGKINAKAVFPFIGFTPVSNFVSDNLVKKENGFIITNENMETSVPGLYCAGDINKKMFRQISTAISDGTIAALAVKKYIDENDWE